MISPEPDASLEMEIHFRFPKGPLGDPVAGKCFPDSATRFVAANPNLIEDRLGISDYPLALPSRVDAEFLSA